MSWFYYVGRGIARLLLFLLARWQVIGRENIPRKGPLLVVANHLNLADPPVLSVSINRKNVFMAKEELFRAKFSSYFVRNFGAFPVRRDMGRDALRQAERVLEQGLALIMFPEGRRSRQAKLQPAFPGTAMVAAKTGVPILPVGIAGTEAVGKSGWLLRRPRITVRIGRPFYLPQVNGKLSKEELARFTYTIMEHIAELLPIKYRGIYGSTGSPRSATKKATHSESG